MPNRLVPSQIRGARGMLNWSMLDLARAAGLSVSTIKRMETSASQPVSDAAHASVREACEGSGIRFLRDGDGAVGMMFTAMSASPPRAMVLAEDPA